MTRTEAVAREYLRLDKRNPDEWETVAQTVAAMLAAAGSVGVTEEAVEAAAKAIYPPGVERMARAIENWAARRQLGPEWDLATEAELRAALAAYRSASPPEGGE